MVPNSNYRDKYAHLIGSDAEPPEETARKTETNKSYGIGIINRVFVEEKNNINFA